MVLFSCVTGIFSFIDNIGTLQAILFIIGLLLLLAEMFMPGFGLVGGTGLVLMIAGIISTAQTPAEAMIMIVILLVLVALVLLFILRSAKKGKLAKKLILWSAARHDAGFKSTTDHSNLIGSEGVALTVLRPAGTGEFADQRLDVVTDGSYIESGMPIRIIRTEGRRIVVEPIK